MNRKAAWNFDSQATYVIAGGLGGLGRGIARWMASRGAQYMVLLSRSGAKSEAGKALVDELSTSGVRVEAPCCDITQLDVLERVIAEITKTMPPIKGCVQGTMVLRVLFPFTVNGAGDISTDFGIGHHIREHDIRGFHRQHSPKSARVMASTQSPT